MVKELYNLFKVNKIRSESGSIIRAGSKLDSKKIIQLPYNSLVAISLPYINKIVDGKIRLQIIYPIKGWLYEEDIIFLDTLEYLRYGSKYETHIVNKMIEHGIEHVMEKTEIINDTNVAVFIIPSENNKNKNNIDAKTMQKFSDIYEKENLKNTNDFITELTKNKYIHELPTLNIPIIILAGSSWCQQCIDLKYILIKIINEIKDIKLYILDIDSDPDLKDMLKLKTISNILLYNKDKQIEHLDKLDYTKEYLEEKLTKFKENYNYTV